MVKYNYAKLKKNFYIFSNLGLITVSLVEMILYQFLLNSCNLIYIYIYMENGKFYCTFKVVFGIWNIYYISENLQGNVIFICLVQQLKKHSWEYKHSQEYLFKI